MSGVGVVGGVTSSLPLLSQPNQVQKFSLEISPVAVELAPGIKIMTTGYNGQVPGPILRMKAGIPARVSITNRTDREELVHWHGMDIGSIPDGAAEEGSPFLKPQGRRAYEFVPGPIGTRWYHTHTMAMNDLGVAGYSGQYGFLMIEPSSHPGDYDAEVFLAIHHWNPSLAISEDRYDNCPVVRYQYASFNDRMLGANDPIRVRQGQRVLFHFLNASATEDVSLALPGHRFEVVALDGNPVPRTERVSVVSLSVAERIDAIVEMDQPGCWILGSTSSQERSKGLGVVVEYAGHSAKPTWKDPGISDWSYSLFSATVGKRPEPDEIFTMMFEKKMPGNAEKHDHSAMHHAPSDLITMPEWTINGKPFKQLDALKVKEGKRYRFRFINNTGCAHPVHLHRHRFELVTVDQVPVSGIWKDTANLRRFNMIEADFIADNPGPTLFHCHHQMHMDYGFMQLIEYI